MLALPNPYTAAYFSRAMSSTAHILLWTSEYFPNLNYTGEQSIVLLTGYLCMVAKHEVRDMHQILMNETQKDTSTITCLLLYRDELCN